MPPLSKIIEAPLRLLGEHKVECVIVGGVAAVIHGSLLLTNDLDVCYSRDPANLRRMINLAYVPFVAQFINQMSASAAT